jgi:hypothetical protein
MATNLHEHISVDFSKVLHFSPSEFPEDPVAHSLSSLIYTLDDIRKEWRQRIFPSPVKGALARFKGSGTSQHYAIGRKSTAVDIFPEGIPIVFLLTLQRFPQIKGIGIYRDTFGPDGQYWTMFHIDVREKGFNDTAPLIWISLKDYSGMRKYYYPQKDTSKWALLNYSLFFKPKVFRKRK